MQLVTWKTLTIPLHTNLQTWHNRPVQSFLASHWLNAEGLSFNYRASDVKYFNLIFFLQCWEPLNINYSVWAHAAMTLCTSTSHYKVQLSVPIFHSCLSTWRLHNRSTILWCKEPNLPVVSVFHAYCQRLKYILLLLQFEIFSAFTSQGIASSRLLPIIYWSDEFLNRVSRALIFKHCPEPQHLWRTFLQPHAVCTPQN